MYRKNETKLLTRQMKEGEQMAQKKKVVRMQDFKGNKLQFNIGLLIFLVIFIYLVIAVVVSMNKKHIVGYEVSKGTLSVSSVYEGIAVRDEMTVSCNGVGYINFFAKEDEHLAAGDLVYTLDNTGKIAEMMEQQESEMLLSEEDQKNLRSQMIHFQNQFSPEEFDRLYDFQDQLSSTTLKLSNYNMLHNMSAQNNNSDNLTFQYAPCSGLISYEIDGYESLRPEMVTKDMFEKKDYEAKHLESNQLASTEDTAYKLILDENWSIVIPVEEARGSELEAEEYVKVKFIKNQYESWAKVTLLHNMGDTFVQLDFTNSMITFASERFIDLEILASQEEGLKVPISAITEQEFYLIPLAYKAEGGNNGKSGFTKETYDEDGKPATEFVEAKIYYADDAYYYVDTSQLRVGDYICRTDSSEKYPISRVGSLIGVYNINKGYADFTAITILSSNEEYAIVKSNTSYGLSEYDYIVLDSSTVNADDFVYE